jgi:hypothetical protein
VHGQGHLLAQWLALSDQRRADLACHDAARVLRYGESVLGADRLRAAYAALAQCAPARPAPARIAAARDAAAVTDAVLGQTTGLGSRAGWTMALAVVAAALVLVWQLVGRALLVAAPVAVTLLGVTLLLVLHVERLPGVWPNVARVVLFVLCNLLALALLLWPGKVVQLLERRAWLAPSLLPGLLVVSYTSNTQVESYVAVGVLALVFVTCGTLRARPGFITRLARRRTGTASALLALASFVLLFPAGTRKAELYPAWFFRRPELVLYAALTLVAIWVVCHYRELLGTRRARSIEVLSALTLLLGSLALRRVAPPSVGRLAIVGFAVAAIVFARGGQRTLALFAGVASYCWVSRDFEFLALIPALALAEIVGRSLADPARDGSAAPPGLGHVLALTTFVFGLLYVQRIGLQNSIDIGAMDWGAGGFGDAHVPAWLVGAALTYKYVLAELLVIAAFVSQLPPTVREIALRGCVVAHVARGAILLLMFFVCGGSFWTALRTVGDLPFALTCSLAAIAAWLFVKPWRAVQMP